MMEKDRKFRFVLLGAGACILTLITLFVYAGTRGWTEEKVERTVNRELSPGSDRAQIEAFLDTQGWPHRPCEPINGISYMLREAKLDAADLSEAVLAEVPNPNVGFGGLREGTITVVFFLDHNGRLVRSYIRVWILSL
jgi:hypothetical protein